MLWFGIVLGVLAAIALLIAAAAYICFRLAFYVPTRKPTSPDEIITPKGAIYDPYRERMEQWARETRALPYEEVSITSFDGLTLRGKYYEYAPGAPIELMFHGYRGTAERDLCGGVQRCFALGRSALLVNQRASGDSDGHVITFGIREHRDCLSWVDFMVTHFGEDVRIILTGISMGATTVLIAAGRPLAKNVIGVLADCGFSNAADIMKKVIREMGLPVFPCYGLARLGGRLYGGFDIEEISATESLRSCTVPVIFFHGEDDAFVPSDMSRRNFEACASRKRLVMVPKAGHGLSYPVDPATYLQEVSEFFGENAPSSAP